MGRHLSSRKQPVLVIGSLGGLCAVVTLLAFWGAHLLAALPIDAHRAVAAAMGYFGLAALGMWWLARSTRMPPNREVPRLPRAQTRHR